MSTHARIRLAHQSKLGCDNPRTGFARPQMSNELRHRKIALFRTVFHKFARLSTVIVELSTQDGHNVTTWQRNVLHDSVKNRAIIGEESKVRVALIE